jgi:hypothetical protein
MPGLIDAFECPTLSSDRITGIPRSEDRYGITMTGCRGDEQPQRVGLWALLLTVAAGVGCSSTGPVIPLASTTVHEMRAGPSATHGLETVFIIEAVLDLKATGQLDFFDAKARIAYIEGRHKRMPVERGTLLVEGNTCRMRITLSSKEYTETFGLLDYDPVVRIGFTLSAGTEREAAGVLQRKSSESPNAKDP